MKTNLIFKRTVAGRIEMVMIPVDLPQVNDGEGWTLASCCDAFNIIEKPTIEQVHTQLEECLPPTIREAPYQSSVKEDSSKLQIPVMKQELEEKTAPSSTEDNNIKPIPIGGKYDSSVTGTARLVRYKDKIRITYRKGKTTYNKNEPNSVCIDDYTKQQFFNAVKRAYGRDVTVWQLSVTDTEYAHYNTLIDKLYTQGLTEYNKT